MTPFIIIAIWLLCAFIAAALAHAKKLSVKSWIVVGVLLGPFAVLFVLTEGSPPSDWRSGGSGGTGGGGCGGGSGCGAGGCGGGGCGGGGGG